MKNYLTKAKYLLLSFIGYLILLVVAYTFWNWLFSIHLEWINFNGFITDFAIPALLATAIAFFLMKKNINRLHFKVGSKKDPVYVFIIAGLAVPTIIAQNYISTATGKITVLDTITQIDHTPKTKYYELKEYLLYKGGASAKENIETSGKNNQNLDFEIYFVIPILEKPQDTLKKETHYWLCKRYRHTMSNYASDEKKEIEFKDFVKATEEEFRREQFPFTYLERLKNGSDTKHYGRAASRNKWARNGEDILLEPQSGYYNDRNGSALGWIFKSGGIAIVAFCLLLLCYRLKTSSESNSYNKKMARESKKSWQEKYDFLIPKDHFFFTPIIAYINILIFLWFALTGAGFANIDSNELINKGSIFTPKLQDENEYWRLFTYMFLHGGIIHLVNNLVSLYIVGYFLEPLLGKWKFLAAYLICGVGAGIASYSWHEFVNSVGASGAIFGLYGFMIVMILMKVTDVSSRFFLWIGGTMLAINLVMGMFGNTDNAAHIGGLITGVCISFLFLPFLDQQKES